MRVSMSPRGSVNAIDQSLPARLRQAGDKALVAFVPQLDAIETELAIVAAWAGGGGAAIADPGRVRVARQLGELQAGHEALGIVERFIIGLGLQRGELAGILLNELLAPL